MYTNYPNTEEITPKNDPKGWTQHLGEFSVSLLAEVLQVCYEIWYDQVNPHVLLSAAFCACEINPRKQMLVFLTGHRHLFFLI